jgi:hypothetical protein
MAFGAQIIKIRGNGNEWVKVLCDSLGQVGNEHAQPAGKRLEKKA